MVLISAVAPTATFAAGDPAKPTPKPAAKPDEQRKVWTNDDIVRLNPDYLATNGKPATVITVVPSIVVAAEGPRVATVAVATSAEEDPAWYARQLGVLQEELAAVQAHEDELRNFRVTSTGLPTGLVLNAPCTGISTDNLIANLEAERQAIAAQVDELQDLARKSGFAPGDLAASAAAQPSAGARRAALTRTVEDADAQLEGIQLTEAAMQQQAAGLHAALQLPTPGFGGNMTTDLLDRLNDRAAQLQSTIDSATDAARSLGAVPSDVR